MRKLVLLCLLAQFAFSSPFAQLTLVQKSLTDLHITSNLASQMVTQPDGKIVIFGTLSEGQQFKTVLIRFDSTGKLDGSFGKNGIDTFTTKNLFPKYDVTFFSALALQGDKIILAGGVLNATTILKGGSLVMRFTSKGKIDSTFGTDGSVITSVQTFSDIQRVCVDSAGRIVAVGKCYDYRKYHFLLIRYTPDGKLDVTFAYGGLGIVDIGTSDDQALDVAIYPTGRIMVLGKTFINGQNYTACLMALTNKGFNDETFGAHGIVRTGLSVVATKLLLQGDGKVFFAAGAGNSLTAARYNYNGTQDNSFGLNGVAVINTPYSSCTINSAALQPGGNIVVGGIAVKNNTSSFFTTRLSPTGRLDASFAYNGYFLRSVYHSNDGGYAMCMLPGGKILQAGQVSQGMSTMLGLLKYGVDGLPDVAFGNSGIKVVALGSSRDVAYKMVKLPWDNSILLCGTANEYWSLVKYKANKSLQADSTFGTNGMVTVPYKYDDDQFAEPNVAVDSVLKKIYVCGLIHFNLYILRFNANGTPDVGFGTNGILQYKDVGQYFGGLAVTPQSKIVFGGLKQYGSNGFYFIGMLNPDGSPDITFGVNGEQGGILPSVNSIILDAKTNTIKLCGITPNVQTFNDIAVVSLKMNGEYDSTFGTNGMGILDIDAGSAQSYFKYSLAQDIFGRVVVSGPIQSFNDDFGYVFSVSRFTRSGVPDSGFGTNGLVHFNPGNGVLNFPSNDGVAVGCATGRDCFIATAGIAMDNYFTIAKSVVAVYKNDGTPDKLGLANTYFDKNLFGSPFEGSYAVLIDSVKTYGYTLYVAGTGGRNNNMDFTLAKFTNYSTMRRIDTFVVDNKLVNKVGVYPNPVRRDVSISCTNLQKGPVDVVLVNVTGQIVQQYRFTNGTQGAFNCNIQMPAGLAAGAYFVKIINGQNTVTQKIIKQ